LLLAASLGLACGRSVRHGAGHRQVTMTGGSGGDFGGAGGKADHGGASGMLAQGGTPAGGSAGEDGSAGESEPCTSPKPPPAPLRRLSRFEYANTVRDLFGDTSQLANALPFDAYDDVSAGASTPLVEGYHRLAHDFAASVAGTPADAAAFAGCDPESLGEAACRDEFLDDFVARTFRRPTTADDLAAFSSVFANGRLLVGDFSGGVRAVVEVALQSPEFLYRPELGEPATNRGPGWARPTPYEMASRLSYFFWGSTPDGALLRAAEAGELDTDDGLESQARRLLADDRAGDAVGYFYLRLLRLLDAEFPAAGESTAPRFTAEIPAFLLEETKAFTAALTLDGTSDFKALLTARYTFMNDALAEFYGVPAVTGSTFRRVALEPSQRGGLLTQASFLASNATRDVTLPSRRGWLVTSRFLCSEVLPHPVNSEVPPPVTGQTTRERYTEHASDPTCTACHKLVDPVGFAFEHYDAAGLWRDQESGIPIDASGKLVGPDAAGRFDGALELSALIADSPDAQRCFARNWFSFAHGRSVVDEDACALKELERAFSDQKLNLLELLVSLTKTDAFRYMPEVTP
jgi:hypothetical protein